MPPPVLGRLPGRRCSEPRFGDRRLEKLDRVARWIFHEDLLAADAGDDLVAEASSTLAQARDRCLEVVDLELEAVPPSWFRQRPVGHRLPASGSAARRAEDQAQVAAREH